MLRYFNVSHDALIGLGDISKILCLDIFGLYHDTRFIMIHDIYHHTSIINEKLFKIDPKNWHTDLNKFKCFILTISFTHSFFTNRIIATSFLSTLYIFNKLRNKKTIAAKSSLSKREK